MTSATFSPSCSAARPPRVAVAASSMPAVATCATVSKSISWSRGYGRTLDVTIPVGARDGMTLRLAGHGMPGHGDGPAGDALVQLAVRSHRVFSRDGDDIRLELPVAVDEAVLGGKVQVPTIHGPVSVTVPKGSSSGRVLRLRGKGVRAAGDHGDQLVTLKIVLPSKVDPELERFMTEWRDEHAYDPRADLMKETG